MQYKLLVISFFGWLSLVVCDGITITGAQCGQRACNLTEYCSDFDKTCQPCSVICVKSHHNFDKLLCERECQDYLHDERYVRKNTSGSSDSDDGLRSTVAKLSRMLTVTLTLVCLMLIVLAGVLCFQLYRWKIKKNITIASLKQKLFGGRQSPENNTTNKTKDVSHTEHKKPELKLEMPTTGSNSDHSPMTMTTSISRRPAEDSTLDYAYDNHAMSSPRRLETPQRLRPIGRAS